MSSTFFSLRSSRSASRSSSTGTGSQTSA